MTTATAGADRPRTELPPVEQRCVLPAGFAAGATTAGIKASGRPDLALIRSLAGPVPAAAVFTPNRLAAAPVRLSRSHLAAGRSGGGHALASVVVATSGSANAATGPEGEADQAALAAAVAEIAGCRPEETLALSTGVIGTRLPVPQVVDCLRELAATGLATDDAAFEAVATAIMTTDTRPKWASVRVDLADGGGTPRPVTVAGVAKGVGMIHPRMATMLAVLLTDAAVEPALLGSILRTAAARTWDQLTVDGDTSTNDTVFLLASGAAGGPVVVARSKAATTLAGAVEAVARSLARQQAADGEGATTLITCTATGAADDADARAVARAVVASSLVKAAIHGRDPNWGRIAAAAANAHLADAAVLEAAGLPAEEAVARAGREVDVEPDRLAVSIAGVPVFAGRPLPFDRDAVRRAMDAPEVVLGVDLGIGGGRGEAFGCDLTEQYVVENAEYTT